MITAQTPLGRTVYVPEERISSLSEIKKKIINLNELLSSTDEPDLFNGGNTLNTSLNETILMLLHGRCAGANLINCNNTPMEKVTGLLNLMRKKADVLNRFHGQGKYFKFDPKTVYSIRKPEELHFDADYFLPIAFQKNGLYLVPAYMDYAPYESIRLIDCDAIFR